MLSYKVTTESVRLAMYIVGINLYDGKNNLFTYLRFCIFCSCLVTCNVQLLLFSIFNRTEFYNVVIPAAYISITTIGIINILYFFTYQETISSILRELDREIFKYPDEENLTINYQWPLGREHWPSVHFLAFMYECMGFILSGLSPAIGVIAFGKESLIYPGWYPWDINPRRSFMLTYASQMVIASCVLWTCYLVQLYIVFVTVELLREFKKIRVALKTMDERTKILTLRRIGYEEGVFDMKDLVLSRSRDADSNDVKLFKKTYNEIYAQNLIYCFKHHQALIKVFDSFKAWFEIYYTTELTGSMMTFALVFYCLVEVEAYERLLTLLGVSLLAVTNLFSRCFIGEVLSEIHEKVTETIIYETNWYDQALRNRKMLFIFHLQVSRPLDLFGFSIFKASFYTFAAVSRLSYSYLNLIRASLNKK